MGIITDTAKKFMKSSGRTAARVAGAVWDNRAELAEAARAGSWVVTVAGKSVAGGAAATGRFLIDHRSEIAAGAAIAGNTVVATGKGASQLGCDAGAMAIYRDSRIAELRRTLHRQGLRYRAAVEAGWQGAPGAESLAVGGSLLADIISTGHTPADVQQAYELAYPHVADKLTFAEEASRLHGQELVGLANGVKGKLFEMKYVDYLNHGELPDGYTAHLAASSVQPGWDIAVSGPDGHTAQLLQLKAADSVTYVKSALAHHPDIKVITTDEVYDKLVLHGAAAGVHESGISNAALGDHVAHAASDSAIHMHWAPPVIALALHAFSAYRMDGDVDEKISHFGERAGKSWLCYLLGGAVAATTQIGWLGLAAGLGTRYLAAKGRARRELCQEMERQVARNERLLSYQRACLPAP